MGVGAEGVPKPFRPTSASSGAAMGGAPSAMGTGKGTAAPGWRGICVGPVALGVKLGAMSRALAGAGAIAFAAL